MRVKETTHHRGFHFQTIKSITLREIQIQELNISLKKALKISVNDIFTLVVVVYVQDCGFSGLMAEAGGLVWSGTEDLGEGGRGCGRGHAVQDGGDSAVTHEGRCRKR